MGGYLGSITVPRPLSRFDTHPQAKLKTFETKMAAITQSARSQRYLWKKWGAVNSPITNGDPNLVSSKRCGSPKVLPRVQNSLTERKTMHKYAKYIFSSLYLFCEEWQISRRVLSTSAFGLMEDNILLNRFFFHIILSLPHSFVLKHSSDWFSALVESLLLYLKVSVINWLFNCI